MKTFIKQVLWWLLRAVSGSDKVPLRVLSGPAKGVRLNLDVRTQGSYWIGNYDEYATRRIPFARYLAEGDVAWDCGAFVGFYAAIFRKLVGESGKVAVFEASSANFAALALMPALNGWKNVQVCHAAVGPSHTTIEFVGDHGGASGPLGLSPRFESAAGRNVEAVECFGVDQLAFEKGFRLPRLLKFDLEGAEQHALHNGPEVFGRIRPALLLELHGPKALHATVRFMNEYRYTAVPVHKLDRFKEVSEVQWLASLRAHTLRDGSSLASSEMPHMILALPTEHPDLET